MRIRHIPAAALLGLSLRGQSLAETPKVARRGVAEFWKRRSVEP